MLKTLASQACKAGFACVLGAAFVLAPVMVQARGVPTEGTGTVAVAELPPQARKTYALIFQGGPFPYDKDGSVFGNRERLLPMQKRGYYLEYTVKTSGSHDRGARRIVCGGKPMIPVVCYYTDDHYASFRAIAQ